RPLRPHQRRPRPRRRGSRPLSVMIRTRPNSGDSSANSSPPSPSAPLATPLTVPHAPQMNVKKKKQKNNDGAKLMELTTDRHRHHHRQVSPLSWAGSRT